MRAATFSMGLNTVLWNPVEAFKDVTPMGGIPAMQPMDNIHDLSGMLSEVSTYSGDAVFVLQDTRFFYE